MSKKKVVMGIDPGISGFVAVMDVYNGKLLETSRTKNLEAIAKTFNKYKKSYKIVKIAFEKITGTAANTPASALTLGKNVGQLEATIEAEGLTPVVKTFTSTQWQRSLKHHLKEISSKAASVGVASKLAGKTIRNHNEADAINLAASALIIYKKEQEVPTKLKKSLTVKKKKTKK
mgnify:CR=1 FL=1